MSHPTRLTVLLAALAILLAGCAGPRCDPPPTAPKRPPAAPARGFAATRSANGDVTLRGPNATLAFAAGSRRFLFNDTVVWMNGPLTTSGGSWRLTPEDASEVVAPLLTNGRHTPTPGHTTVVIDPGHGGRDSGAIGVNGLREKDVVLDISRRLATRLKRRGLTVKLTRGGDSWLELWERTARARKWNAHIFVSIHINAASSRTANGVETFVLPAPGYPSTADTRRRARKVAYPGNRHGAANTLLGYHVQRELVAHTRAEDRGVKRARFEVLRSAPCPAVLVECGFASNHGEGKRLAQPGFRDTVSDAIAHGIAAYIKAVEAGPCLPGKGAGVSRKRR